MILELLTSLSIKGFKIIWNKNLRVQFWRSQQIILHKDSIHIHGLQKSNQQNWTNVLRLLQRIRNVYFQIWYESHIYYTIFLNISHKHHINTTSDKKVPHTMPMQCNGLPFCKLHFDTLNYEYFMNIISNHPVSFDKVVPRDGWYAGWYLKPSPAARIGKLQYVTSMIWSELNI